jgi:hypothetical protein
MPDDALETQITAEPNPGTSEWLDWRLEQMRNAKRTGTLPEDRDSILRRLGYPSYENYRTRVLWKRIRDRIRERDQNNCRRCDEIENKMRHEVHHDAYTEAVLKGEDDSLLFLLCSSCHRKVEFDSNGFRRSDDEKRRVLRDREGAWLEKGQTEQAKTASNGRCYWCKGDTEISLWGCGGKLYVMPTVQGDDIGVWMCSVCISNLSHDQDGHPRSDNERLALLGKKANVRYNRRKPSTSFVFNKNFWKLNAMQRELLMNDYHRNCEILHSGHKSNAE